MHIRRIIMTLATLLVVTIASAASPSAEGDKLTRLLKRDWEWYLREFPPAATGIGDPRYDDRWTDVSIGALQKRATHTAELQAELRKIERAKLSDQDRLNYDLFVRDVDLTVEGKRFHGSYARTDDWTDIHPFMPITQMGGMQQDVADTLRNQPKRTVQDYENILKRLRAVPLLADQTIALMREGLKSQITPPRIALREVEKLLAFQVVDDPKKSPVYEVAFAQMPDSIPAVEQKRLRAEGLRLITESVVPAYRKLHTFFVSDYYPRTRETIGLSALPNGAEWYNHMIRRNTTTDMTASQIHELGLREVSRIRAEMESIKEKTGFKGDLQQFFKHLRTDPKFFYTDKEAFLTGYRDICKRIDPELARMFGVLPRLTYGVVPVPEYSERTQTTAYYNPGSPQAGRPGNFYANTYNLPTRPKWEMEALSLHEAVPGHHLQISRAQELESLPDFRQHAGYGAFVEGWALYGESLGGELGLYKDPYSKFGQLTYEMWRAVRLVVDTGMHAKGWTRDQAIKYFVENAAKSEHDITVEIDRYIVWPGQALAYKIGELKIKELRAMATKELGPRFDIRKFHDTVIGSGALPLSVLETRVKEWVTAQKRAN